MCHDFVPVPHARIRSWTSRPMKYSFLTALALCSSFMPLAAADGSQWMTDYAAAKKKAADAKKDLLLEFTRSDWCSRCMELSKEVFSKDAFTTGAEAKFVLVALDFPRDESKLRDGIKEQNAELARQYGIEEFPTIVLTDAEGRPYAQTGYEPGGPEAYLKHLDELQDLRKERDATLAAGRQLTGVDKAKALQYAIAEFPDMIVEAFYSELTKEIEAADPKDETGFQKSRAYRREVAAYEERITTLFDEKKFDEVFKEADRFMKIHDPTGLDKQHIMMARIMAYAETGKKNEALKALAEMKAVAPESGLGVQADGFKERIERFFDESTPKNK